MFRAFLTDNAVCAKGVFINSPPTYPQSINRAIVWAQWLYLFKRSRVFPQFAEREREREITVD